MGVVCSHRGSSGPAGVVVTLLCWAWVVTNWIDEQTEGYLELAKILVVVLVTGWVEVTLKLLNLSYNIRKMCVFAKLCRQVCLGLSRVL